jgi:tetratricopeptide (TPR) repeat protein
MFDGLLSKQKESLTNEAGGRSNNVLLFGSVGLIVMGVSLMAVAAFEYLTTSDTPKPQQTTQKSDIKPAVQIALKSASEVQAAYVPSTAPAVSAPGISATTTSTASDQLSLNDQKIYDESLNLINQFDGNENQLEMAYKMLVDLAKRNPKSGYPYAALADLKFRLAGLGEGSFSDAYTLAQRSITLDPNIADAYVVVTKVSIEQGRLMDAREAAKKAIALAPNKPEAMFAMARATEKWAEGGIKEGWSAASQAKYGAPEQLYGESERWYRKAIDTYNDNIRKSNIYFWLGNMLSNKMPADIAGATAAFTKSAELAFDDSPWSLNDIGIFLIGNTDRYDQAISYFEQALKLKKFDAARLNLGLAEYYKWGDSKRNPEKYKNAQRKPLSPEEITVKTGVTPEYAFVKNAGVRAAPHAAVALLENGFIKNVDIVPKGLTGTALIYAANAKANRQELAKLLIAKRANVNFVDKEDQITAIFWATHRNNFDMVKLLVKSGARLNLADAGGTPLVNYALSWNQASGKPAPALLGYLLQHGADPTISNKYGSTVLDNAVSWNDVEAVRLLVNKYHAEVNTYIPGKRSSLLEGAKSEVTEILLKAGANPWVMGMDDVDLVAKKMSPLNEGNPDWPEIKKSAALILEARKHYPKPKDFGQEYQGEIWTPK